MGHITNPVGFRAGRVTSWLSNWSSDRYTYANNWIMDISLQRYFEYLFKKMQYLSYRSGFIFSHVTVFRLSTFFIVNIYLYNANVMLFYRGRFFYYWKRIRIIREGRLFRRALVVNCFKKPLLQSIISGVSQRRSMIFKLKFSAKFLSLSRYAKKNPFYYIMSRVIFLSKRSHIALLNPIIPYFLAKSSLIYRRSLFFKRRHALFPDTFNKYFVFNQKSIATL